jgi:hypothetical protein
MTEGDGSMAQSNNKNVQVRLKLSTLKPDGCVTLASVVAQKAPKSAIYGSNPAVKDAADKAVKSGAELGAAATDMQDAELKLAAAKSALGTAQGKFTRDMLCFKSVAEANCETAAELNDLGFNQRSPKAAPGPLTAPDSIVAKAGKEKGSMLVHARGAGRASAYVAEISVDPVGPGTWQTIPGSGARRTLTGYVSGGKYWVRFRSVRANEESAWSEAVSAVAR